jgi:hypothetical protein
MPGIELSLQAQHWICITASSSQALGKNGRNAPETNLSLKCLSLCPGAECCHEFAFPNRPCRQESELLNERILIFFVESVQLLSNQFNRVLLHKNVSIVQIGDNKARSIVFLLIVKPKQKLLDRDVARHKNTGLGSNHDVPTDAHKSCPHSMSPLRLGCREIDREKA